MSGGYQEANSENLAVAPEHFDIYQPFYSFSVKKVYLKQTFIAYSTLEKID